MLSHGLQYKKPMSVSPMKLFPWLMIGSWLIQVHLEAAVKMEAINKYLMGKTSHFFSCVVW